MKSFVFLKNLLIAAILFFVFSCNPKQDENKKPNILFIAVDDLRPQLNCYGKSQIISPNIDRIANEGVAFERAYCNVPVCGASRASLLSGLRPSDKRFLTYFSRADKETPDAITLPEHFKNNGYQTISLGKIFHDAGDHETKAWSVPPLRYDHYRIEVGKWGDKGWQNYITEPNIEIAKTKENGAAMPYEIADVPDSAYADGKIANRAIEQLHRLKDRQEPFFLAVGFLKPHLPFNAPKKYWDLYPYEDINLADNMFFPKNAPKEANHNWGELRAYYTIPPKGPVSDSLAQKLIQGYYSCVSYTDAQIGYLLDELEKLGLKENTIIVLWGDHGWNLGEHGLWCKHCNFHNALNAPLLVSVPGIKGNIKINSLVEFVDIYPSLCDLAGLDKPSHLQGDSFLPLLKGETGAAKEEVFCRWQSGESVKTDKYLYTEWFDKSDSSYARMLFDHTKDPMENNNVSEEPEYKIIVEELSSKVKQERVRRDEDGFDPPTK